MISYPKVANLSVVKVSRLHHTFSYYYLSTKEEEQNSLELGVLMVIIYA